MIDRRNFTIGATLAVVVQPLQLLRCQQLTTPPSPTGGAFLIHGWDISVENSDAEAMWLRVDRSWRTAWR